MATRLEPWLGYAPLPPRLPEETLLAGYRAPALVTVACACGGTLTARDELEAKAAEARLHRLSTVHQHWAAGRFR